MARVTLSDYGYVNARVRSMRTHLLTRGFFKRLVEAEGFKELHSLMEETVYRREINEVILLDADRPDYDRAFNQNLVASLKKIQDSTGGEPHRLVDLLLSRWDLLNVKSILRGKRGNASNSSIVEVLVPVGNIKMGVLEELVAQKDVREVIDLMATLRIRYSRPLTASLGRYFDSDEDLMILELALDKFYYQDAIASLEGKDKNVDMVRQMFVAEIDMRNISSLMRIQESKLSPFQIANLRIPKGTLSADDFTALGRLGDVTRVVEEFPDPEYKKTLEKAVPAYHTSGVVAFERELEKRLVKRAVDMSNVDVLSIGVIIGYMWAKYNEIINLRIVFRGKTLDEPQSSIEENLFFPGEKEAVAQAQ